MASLTQLAPQALRQGWLMVKRKGLLPVASALALLPCRFASAELEPPCAENSPERRGELGCSYVADKPLPELGKGPLVWHIDRFASQADAEKAAGEPVSRCRRTEPGGS